MAVLKWLGALILITWLVLWLAVKITFGAIHLLFVLGVALLLIGLFKSATR
jgi:hypothetical protein